MCLWYLPQKISEYPNFVTQLALDWDENRSQPVKRMHNQSPDVTVWWCRNQPGEAEGQPVPPWQARPWLQGLGGIHLTQGEPERSSQSLWGHRVNESQFSSRIGYWCSIFGNVSRKIYPQVYILLLLPCFRSLEFCPHTVCGFWALSLILFLIKVIFSFQALHHTLSLPHLPWSQGSQKSCHSHPHLWHDRVWSSQDIPHPWGLVLSCLLSLIYCNYFWGNFIPWLKCKCLCAAMNQQKPNTNFRLLPALPVRWDFSIYEFFCS